MEIAFRKKPGDRPARARVHAVWVPGEIAVCGNWAQDWPSLAGNRAVTCNKCRSKIEELLAGIGRSYADFEKGLVDADTLLDGRSLCGLFPLAKEVGLLLDNKKKFDSFEVLEEQGVQFGGSGVFYPENWRKGVAFTPIDGETD
jgi:hypothetical protein